MAKFLTNHFLPDFAAFLSKPCKYMIISILVFTLGDTRGKADEIADLHHYTRNRTKSCTPTQEIAQNLAFPLRRNGGSVFLGVTQWRGQRSLNVTCNMQHCNNVTMEATSSRTGRPSGSSDISSDAWLCVGLRIIRKHKKLLQPSLSLQDYRSGPRKRSISWNPFSPCAKGAIATAETLFFDPADAVSDPKMVRIWGNPTRFSLFFLTPQMQFLTLKRYAFWGIQLAFPCFLSEKRA